MLKTNRILLATTALIAVSAFPVAAASVPLLTGPSGSNPAQFPADLPDINSTINAINSSGATGINANTLAPPSTPRNFLDNGSINIAQRGTTAIAGNSSCNITGSTQAYTADRWCVTSNVPTSAATGTVVTSSPTPLAGFTNSLNITRGSGANTAQICGIQEIQTARSLALAGRTVTYSVYMQALAGLSADNANAANITVIYGTGTDQGLQSYSSATVGTNTPNWTGINATITKAVTLTTGWVRYTVTGTIPSTATEVGVMNCFTPASGSGGTTDGFAMVGAQLEVGATPSAYEFQPIGQELAAAQRYFQRVSENTQSGSFQGFVGLQVTSQNCTGFVSFPVAMRIAPTYTSQLSGTTFALVGSSIPATPQALASTFSATVGTNTTTNASIRFITTSGTAIVNGNQCMLISANGSGKLDFSADF